MSAPFRDDLAAALDHAEQLATENRSLREELERLRGSPPPEPPPAPAPTPAVVSPPDSMKDRALDRLERLSEEIDAHAASVEAPAPPPEPAPPRIERPMAMAPLNLPPPLAPLAGAPSEGERFRALTAENAALRVRHAGMRRFASAFALGAWVFGILVGWVLGMAMR